MDPKHWQADPGAETETGSPPEGGRGLGKNGCVSDRESALLHTVSLPSNLCAPSRLGENSTWAAQGQEALVEEGRGSPTGPSWDTVCMLKDSSWPGFCRSSCRLEKALAIILLFLIRLGSSSLCPVNLRVEGIGKEREETAASHQILGRASDAILSREGGSQGPQVLQRLRSRGLLCKEVGPECRAPVCPALQSLHS